MTNTMKLVYTALFMALGVVLPITFHFVGAMGAIFLPMHIPVLMAGLLLGGKSGMAVGVIAPALSSFFTGMPPVIPVLPLMVIELALYGVVSGYLYHNRKISLFASLVGAMILGRLGTVAAIFLMVQLVHINIPPLGYLIGGITTGFPGILIQMVLIPLLVKRLEGSYLKISHIKGEQS
ncbi:riboflavin transporter FmnP [Sporomusaceae bacterium BoRhaA]|uniref:ECF transporter S component n=1 Tax=Pelorhabdus rhamnosifermentans TaxID=2772457 RepID=UPI001C060E43|nr:ECF transporter S component [Pelorhabdus rhamnosifermentans]MBU2700301.1 riboflavin transporter FmnP [Pelorhabdus rhamnosifermentans]